MTDKELTFKEKEIDAKELTEMVIELPYEQRKSIHDIIMGYHLLSGVKKENKEPA